MTNPPGPSSSDYEYPDEAGYPDGVGTLSEDQIVLMDEVAADDHAPAMNFFVVNDESTATYEAISGDTVLGGLTYNVAEGDRIVLVAAAVFPEFRGQGIATELIRRVLDEMRARGKTVTVLCPIVWAFLDRNPGYTDLLDPKLPGVDKRPRTSGRPRSGTVRRPPNACRDCGSVERRIVG